MPDASQGIQIDGESPSVQTHLGILQGVIDRMASNSTSSKAWCITIVSAILVVVAGKDKPDYALLALIPTFLFLVFDAYYLALEKGFRNTYDAFVRKVHSNTLMADDLYAIKPLGSMWLLQLEAFRSFSIWGFYIVIGVLTGLARWVVLS